MKIRVALLIMICFATASTSVAEIISYAGTLLGSNEVPDTLSTGTGSALVTIDTIANTLHVQVSFSGLLGTSTNSHIHCCTPITAGVATTTPSFAGFPSGVTSGTYDNILDLLAATSYNPAFVTANGGTPASAEAALLAGLAAGNAYLNVHSSRNAGGEIRANLVPTPEPGSLAMMGAALAGLFAVRRRRHS